MTSLLREQTTSFPSCDRTARNRKCAPHHLNCSLTRRLHGCSTYISKLNPIEGFLPIEVGDQSRTLVNCSGQFVSLPIQTQGTLCYLKSLIVEARLVFVLCVKRLGFWGDGSRDLPCEPAAAGLRCVTAEGPTHLLVLTCVSLPNESLIQLLRVAYWDMRWTVKA